jgi:hypothetical protein
MGVETTLFLIVLFPLIFPAAILCARSCAHETEIVRIGYVFSGIDFRLALLQHFAVFAQTFCISLWLGLV